MFSIVHISSHDGVDGAVLFFLLDGEAYDGSKRDFPRGVLGAATLRSSYTENQRLGCVLGQLHREPEVRLCSGSATQRTRG